MSKDDARHGLEAIKADFAAFAERMLKLHDALEKDLAGIRQLEQSAIERIGRVAARELAVKNREDEVVQFWAAFRVAMKDVAKLTADKKLLMAALPEPVEAQAEASEYSKVKQME